MQLLGRRSVAFYPLRRQEHIVCSAMNPYHYYPGGYMRGHPMHPQAPRPLNRGIPPPSLLMQHATMASMARAYQEQLRAAAPLIRSPGDIDDHRGK